MVWRGAPLPRPSIIQVNDEPPFSLIPVSDGLERSSSLAMLDTGYRRPPFSIIPVSDGLERSSSPSHLDTG